MYGRKSLKQIAGDNIKLDDKQMNKDLAKKRLTNFTFLIEQYKLVLL